MFDTYFSNFEETAVHKIAVVSSVASQVIRTLEQEFTNDRNGRDAAIDALLQLLIKHKDIPAKEITPTA